MRLYHPGVLRTLVLLGAILIIAGCTAPQVAEANIRVHLSADGGTLDVEVPAGSTVDDALKAAGIIASPLDRTDPPAYTVLGEGSEVRLIRVQEEFTIEQVVVPYESQVLRNESLPEGQEYWLQLGENGLQEITIRRIVEDGEEVSSSRVKTVTVKEAVPQIKMVGVQKPFAPLTIAGRIAYLVDGDAWVMEETTAKRRQIITSGDLDGRVFSLSPDGSWLLYTRRSEDENTINTLWAAPVAEGTSEPVDLGIANVVHFADWKPGSVLTVAFSTVEPRPGAPGWQANNDLALLTFSSTGFIRQLPVVMEVNMGGLYGWWGTNFTWAPDGLRLGYARPDSIGVVDLQTSSLTPLEEYTPLQTFGDWAWVPGIAWGPDGNFLYGVIQSQPEAAQRFDLMAADPTQGDPMVIVPDVGMFAYPVTSPLDESPSGERAFEVAYLQAAFPAQSESSRYRLMVMDRDGSNRRVLFPVEGAGGLEPQRVVWSPQPLQAGIGHALAVIYQDNLWLVDSLTGEAWQVTGDGLTSRVDWK